MKGENMNNVVFESRAIFTFLRKIMFSIISKQLYCKTILYVSYYFCVLFCLLEKFVEIPYW